MSNVLCTPARTGAAIGAVTGVIVWALMSWVPAFHNGVPEAVVAAIPVAVAWAGHVIGARMTPHPPVPAPAPPAPAARG